MNLLHAGMRRSVAVAATVSLVATALAAVGLATSPAAAADVITFRAGAQATYNQVTARVTIPQTVAATDGMLLFVTKNNASASVTSPPAGWDLEGTVTASTDTQTLLYSRVAVAADAGRNAAITFSATTKSTITLLAYDGTAADPVSAVASAAETVSRAAHTTPVAQVTSAGSYVVSYWADKSASLSTGWTLPAGQAERSVALGTGAGRITSVASDSGGPAGVGPTTARTATGAAATAKATMWTVVLQADDTTTANVAPVASFTLSCPQATCTVDASGSSDTAPGTVSSYAWDFGDGATGTGVSTTHTYATGGPRTITLRVTDDQGLVSAPATRTANPTVALPSAGQPRHDRLVPDRPRTNTPRISNGEIWDIEVVPSLNRVFIAGNFTSLANTISPTTTINQAGLASYNYQTGLIDTSFRPAFNGGVSAVEASPDGTKLFVGGSFNTVNGIAKQKVASLNLTTGAPLSTFGFTSSTNNQVQSLAASNSTLYVGGRYTRVNGVLRTGLAAVDAASGVVDTAFDNQLSGGIGVDGQLGVPQLRLTYDGSKLLVVHTGRQIAGQDRLGMGIIDTATKKLLPWRSQLWDDHLARVGGVTRIYAADIAPDDSYFVVTSGSGGDAPPISDTAIRYPLTSEALNSSDVEPTWISRHFDSIYSVAVTEAAVYIGGHFAWAESASADVPWPGLDNVGYGTGQGLSGYGLGDQVVRRDHLAALSPTTGEALEWNPTDGSNSFEGDKAMAATPRGLFIGGDGMFKGGVRTGRVGFFDFSSVANPPALPDTTILTPIEGRVVANNTPFEVTGTARVATGSVGRVQVRIQDRATKQYLTADNTWTSTLTSVNATLGAGTTSRSWTLGERIVTTNRNLLVSAQAFTAATGGTGDSTQATKRFESFGIEDQTPATAITAPSGVQTSTTFTVTGTGTDDKGVNALTFWFRDAQGRYLQNDGTVGDIYNTFRGTPDVIGATSATWSYEVTLPHEGVWRGSATAVDTIGQADLRSAVRDWMVDSTAVAPSVTIADPVPMTPPFTVPAVTVEPGGRITFAGTASDDDGLRNVEVTLRNSATGEVLAADGTWGTGISQGLHRVSPVDIPGSTYNWSWTTPFNLSAGTYPFTVRATDDDGLTTATVNRGSLTINAQYAGDLAPDATMAFTAPTDKSPTITLTGAATDDVGVESVRVSLQDRDTGRYLQANGTMAAAIAYRTATLGSPTGTSTSWTLEPITLPSGGNWRFTVIAVDTRGQQDPTPVVGTYRFYPGDGSPSLSETLGQPVTGSSFTDGKIVVTGRAEDAPDAFAGIARVEIGIVSSSGLYMASNGTFTSSTPSWRTAFLNSPGSAGSNYSYTTPVVPAGTYSVVVRSVDVHEQVMDPPRTATGVTVTSPSNNPPEAAFTYTCNQNVCTFDGRGSTDENPTALTYTWNFGTQGTATGPLPTRTFTAPGTFPVTLTVRDEWTVTHTSAPQSVTIVEPSGNAAPVPTFAHSCQGLTCAVSSAGTADPNTGDSIAYSWSWGDGTALSTGASPAAHVYAAAGTYTITLTTTDGWGRSASTTRSVTLAEPAGNTAPTVGFTVSCASFTVCTTNSSGTADPQGDALRYSWSWGDGSAPSTTANPTKTYTTTGTYEIVLTVTDVWGKAATATRSVTMAPPAGNNAPTAVIAGGTCATTNTTCTLNATGSSDPDGASGDAVRDYVWSWGDGTPDTTGSTPTQAHVFPVPGTYTVTLRVRDKWGTTSAPVSTSVSTASEPAGNAGPTVVFNQPACTVRTCTVSSNGTADGDGGVRGYTWRWGDGTPDTVTTTTALQNHTYAAAGTYTVTLVATDNWGRTTTVTRQVTLA